MNLERASDPKGHEATPVVQCELIQHISPVGKFKMLGCGMVFNSSCTTSVIWLSHKNRDDETDRFLATDPTA